MQNKEMYEYKESKHDIRGQRTASEVIGITQPILSKILNKKITCRKVVAFSITKYIDKDANRGGYFIIR